jgi:hypothetical protein
MPFAAAAELVAGAPSSAHPAASDAPQLALPWRQQRRREKARFCAPQHVSRWPWQGSDRY